MNAPPTPAANNSTANTVNNNKVGEKMAGWKNSAKQWFDKVPLAAKIGALAVLLIIGFALVATLVGSARREQAKKNQPLVLRLIKESSRWGTSSAQDDSPLVSLMHANYALAYARASREVMSEADIARYLRIDLAELIHFLNNQQEKAVQRCSRVCPEIVPDAGPISVASGWIG